MNSPTPCSLNTWKAITRKTKAIIPVHWGGASPDIKKIIKISKKYNLHVVEDACMGIGGKISNKHPGTFGIINAFSMHPLKSLNVMGDGGMIVTNDNKELILNFLKSKLLRFFLMTTTYNYGANQKNELHIMNLITIPDKYNEEIDLYHFYQFTKKEIEFIETNVN